MREHPGEAVGIALTAGLLLMRGMNSRTFDCRMVG